MPRLLHTDEVRRSGLVTREHRFEMPLVHSDPADARTIEVFAREVTPAGTEHDNRPFLVWLQGGPGMPADRPTLIGGWIERALADYRVLLLDQRGTGRSTAQTARTIPGDTAAEKAEHLGHFRAPDIVADAEAIRRLLIGDEPWSVLGQSFGGFCSLTYLSFAPAGLRAALITGGLADIHGTAADVYAATFDKLAVRNADYFADYPSDRDRLTALRDHLRDTEEFLPTGERFTPERMLGLGILLGSSTGFHQLHYMIENAFVPGGGQLTETFLAEAGAVLSFGPNPLYAVLHESIYGQGQATAWAAQAARDARPEFAVDANEPLFSGEMVYPWIFEQDPALVTLRETAEILAARADWAPLYDLQQLARNTVPAAAIVFHADMYVPVEASLRTAAAVPGLTPIITSELHHNGIREDGAGLLTKLLTAVRR